MWTVHYLVHILYNPSVLYMIFCSRTTRTAAYCQRWFVVIASQGKSLCIVLYLAYEVFLILLIPDCGLIRVLQQQLGMFAIIVPQSLVSQPWLQLWQPSKLHTGGVSLARSRSGIYLWPFDWLLRYQLSHRLRLDHQMGHASSVATGLCLLLLWQHYDSL